MAEHPPEMPGLDQPPTGAPMPYGPPPSSGMAIAAMILGIVGLVLPCVGLWMISPICSILAVILGFMAKGKVQAGTGSGKGMAIAGIVCGFVGIAIGLLFVACLVLGVAVLDQAAQSPEFQQAVEQFGEQMEKAMEEAAEKQGSP